MPISSTSDQPSLLPETRDEQRDTDTQNIHTDGTLVLVGCGAAKRDPKDPTDLHLASTPAGEQVREFGPEGPAWEAKDLYTSSYFAAKQEFAERVSQGTGTDAAGWGVLSAEHGFLWPWEEVVPYDTTVEDLGDDPTNPAHRVDNNLCLRRPDGREVVTEMDSWARKVAFGLHRWVASHREKGAHPTDCEASTLIVLAGQSYIEPLRERGVFEFGIARMVGDPNSGFKLPVNVRYLFEEIDAGGIGEQMAYLSDAMDKLSEHQPGEQAEMGQWTGEERSCDQCRISAGEANRLVRVGDEVVCQDCHPRQCARCDEWTHQTGIGSYPLCSDCQTEHGGQIREPVDEESAEQQKLI